jgi:hypothetical protein
VTEQLITAADGQHHRAARRRRVERVALRLDHVHRHGGLVTVLATAHVEEIARVRIDRLAHRGSAQLEADPAPLAARAQHRDVPAVGVDIHELRVEAADPQG